jgi:hypothetical protein
VKIQELEDLVSRIEFFIEYEDYQPMSADILKMVRTMRQIVNTLSKLEVNY